MRVVRMRLSCPTCQGRAVVEKWITDSYSYVEYSCSSCGALSPTSIGFNPGDVSGYIKPIVVDGKLRWRRFDSDEFDYPDSESDVYVDYDGFAAAKEPTKWEIRALAAILSIKPEPRIRLLRE